MHGFRPNPAPSKMLFQSTLFLLALLPLASSLSLPSNPITTRATFVGTSAAAVVASPLSLIPSAASAAEDGVTKLKINLKNPEASLTCTLTRAWSPLGYDQFITLVKDKYYDDCPFFRVIPGFCAQFGINPTPSKGSQYAQAIKDDPAGTGPGNLKYTFAFATAGPNTRTTQVFLSLRDNGFLDKQGFTPFGSIDEESHKAVAKIYSGYGEGSPQGKGPNQAMLKVRGETYMGTFPMMTRIESIQIV